VRRRSATVQPTGVASAEASAQVTKRNSGLSCRDGLDRRTHHARGGPSLMSSAGTDRPGRAADGLVAPEGRDLSPGRSGTVSRDAGRGRGHAGTGWADAPPSVSGGCHGCCLTCGIHAHSGWGLDHVHGVGADRRGGLDPCGGGHGGARVVGRQGVPAPGAAPAATAVAPLRRPRRCSARPGCSPCPDRSRSPASMSTAHAAVPHQPPALRGNVIQTLPQRAGQRLSAVLT